MGWIVFEAMLALAVMLAAAWWTFRGRSEPDDLEDDAAPAAEVPADAHEPR
jgi:hypothetical protein